MAEEKYNLKNPAVKRILQEVKEFQNNPSDDYASLPLEDNIFEWHFAIRGPQDTEFEGGIYHGRILLPADYPFKPPAFMLLTPNGRFETQTKICLSISQHHPEHWQPSWSVRTALVALIAFMPTKPDGALGSLDYPKEERRALAIKSRIAAPKFGNSERQKLIDEVHEEMLKKAHPVPEHLPEAPKESDESVKPAEPVLIKEPEGKPELIEGTPEHNGNADAETSILGDQRQDDIVVNPEIQPEEQPQTSAPQNATPQISLQPSTRHQIPDNDRGLTMLAIGLTVAIIALLLKKLAKLYGIGDMTSLFY